MQASVIKNPNHFTIYLAGPMAGRSDIDAKKWRDYMTIKLVDKNINIRNPMDRDYRNHVKFTEKDIKDIVEGDKNDIKRSDLVVVYYDRPSVGTSMEILYAFERNIPVAIINASGNDVISPWLTYHAEYITADIDQMIKYVVEREF